MFEIAAIGMHPRTTPAQHGLADIPGIVAAMNIHSTKFNSELTDVL